MHKGRVRQLAGIRSIDLLSYLKKALVTLLGLYRHDVPLVCDSGGPCHCYRVREIFIPPCKVWYLSPRKQDKYAEERWAAVPCLLGILNFYIHIFAHQDASHPYHQT